MKIMLTSSGITNKSLEKALKELVDGEIKIAFIPTAANTVGIEKEDKEWLIKNYNECLKLGFTDIVDISALDKEVWLPRLKAANVIFMGGGDAIHLINWINKSGLADEIRGLLKDRVYVGISAGSHVACKDLASSSKFLYSKSGSKADKGLGLVDFYVRSHLNSPKFPKVRDEFLKQETQKLNQDCYAIDDDSAVISVDGKIELVSEGKWIKYSV
jgi:dipeptidase E